jgi:hypothetical protein
MRRRRCRRADWAAGTVRLAGRDAGHRAPGTPRTPVPNCRCWRRPTVGATPRSSPTPPSVRCSSRRRARRRPRDAPADFTRLLGDHGTTCSGSTQWIPTPLGPTQPSICRIDGPGCTSFLWHHPGFAGYPAPPARANAPAVRVGLPPSHRIQLRATQSRRWAFPGGSGKWAQKKVGNRCPSIRRSQWYQKKSERWSPTNLVGTPATRRSGWPTRTDMPPSACHSS